jgi:hypothetical protein
LTPNQFQKKKTPRSISSRSTERNQQQTYRRGSSLNVGRIRGPLYIQDLIPSLSLSPKSLGYDVGFNNKKLLLLWWCTGDAMAATNE